MEFGQAQVLGPVIFRIINTKRSDYNMRAYIVQPTKKFDFIHPWFTINLYAAAVLIVILIACRYIPVSMSALLFLLYLMPALECLHN